MADTPQSHTVVPLRPKNAPATDDRENWKLSEQCLELTRAFLSIERFEARRELLQYAIDFAERERTRLP